MNVMSVLIRTPDTWRANVEWRYEAIMAKSAQMFYYTNTLEWRHNERDGFSNPRYIDCLLNRLIGHRSKATPKLCVISLCEGNPPVTDGVPSQRANNNGKYFHLMTSSWPRAVQSQPCDIICSNIRAPGRSALTHWVLLTQWCVSKLCHHWFR